VLGTERGLAVVKTLPGVECLFVHKGARNEPTFALSPGLVARFQAGSPAAATVVHRTGPPQRLP